MDEKRADRTDELMRAAFSFTPAIVMVAFGLAAILAWSYWIQSVLPDAP